MAPPTHVPQGSRIAFNDNPLDCTCFSLAVAKIGALAHQADVRLRRPTFADRFRLLPALTVSATVSITKSTVLR